MTARWPPGEKSSPPDTKPLLTMNSMRCPGTLSAGTPADWESTGEGPGETESVRNTKLALSHPLMPFFLHRGLEA